MLRSDTLMLDNKLFPLYQERVTWLTFTTEHRKILDDLSDDEEDCKVSMKITGMGRGAGKHNMLYKGASWNIILKMM